MAKSHKSCMEQAEIIVTFGTYEHVVVELGRPYKVVGIVPGISYFVQTLQGSKLSKALNGKYLKKYNPSVWQEDSVGNGRYVIIALRTKHGRYIFISLRICMADGVLTSFLDPM